MNEIDMKDEAITLAQIQTAFCSNLIAPITRGVKHSNVNR